MYIVETPSTKYLERHCFFDCREEGNTESSATTKSGCPDHIDIVVLEDVSYVARGSVLNRLE